MGYRTLGQPDAPAEKRMKQPLPEKYQNDIEAFDFDSEATRMRVKLVISLIIIVLAITIAAYSLGNVKVYTLTAQTKFEKRDNSTYLLVSDSKHHFDILWSRHLKKEDVQFYPLKIDNATTYTFTIEAVHHRERFDPMFHRRFEVVHHEGRSDIEYDTYDIMKVTRENHVIYDRKICEIHHRKMERKKVPIVNGLAMPDGRQPTDEQERLLFPHHSESVLGGCWTPLRTIHKFVCIDCKAAYEKWRVENEKK